MKLFVVIACLIAATFAELDDDYEQWISFKVKYERYYEAAEDKFRFEIFQKILRGIEEHNAKYERGEIEWRKGINQFSDWTDEQFQSLLNNKINTDLLLRNTLGVYKADPNEQSAASVDWRSKGAVLPVRNQGNCGGCWAFSASGALEGQLAIQKKQKISLSPQHLIDCSTKNSGCNGGFMDRAFDFVKSEGLSSEANYPYVARKTKCRKNVQKAITSISGYKRVNPTEKDLISAIEKIGPVSVSVGANYWREYTNGIYNITDCGPHVHGVVAVGYTDKYILLKNSWGSSWGEKGYIKLARGSNICGINDYNFYPIL
ncbi:cathepsin L-like proteinase [Diabrotica undecimpunctata]|uniref:cathepsin L-like proteinase n=1 Tax=Diabrotica undecimpunctata TaxID=50387 RepID=UPI003B63501C